MNDAQASARISVLIRTFNSAKTLEKVLSRLALKPGDEILIVDSGSTDATLKIAQRHATVIIAAPPPFNYSKSLNIGFAVAKNSWVVVLSSHSLPVVPDLIGIYRAAIELFPSQAVAGYGRSFSDFEEDFPTKEIKFYGGETFLEIYRYCSNRNTLYRREAWSRLSFDEDLRTAEDKAWAAEMLKAGFEVGAIPAACTLNISQYSLRYMFEKGYSETLAIPHRPMRWIELFRTCRSLLKRPFLYRMPFGNWIRTYALVLGTFCASRKPQDNQPWRS